MAVYLSLNKSNTWNISGLLPPPKNYRMVIGKIRNQMVVNRSLGHWFLVNTQVQLLVFKNYINVINVSEFQYILIQFGQLFLNSQFSDVNIYWRTMYISYIHEARELVSPLGLIFGRIFNFNITVDWSNCCSLKYLCVISSLYFISYVQKV